jgi:hypothetical protein
MKDSEPGSGGRVFRVFVVMVVSLWSRERHYSVIRPLNVTSFSRIGKRGRASVHNGDLGLIKVKRFQKLLQELP